VAVAAGVVPTAGPFSVLPGRASLPLGIAPASVEVTVVELTCRDPLDRRPLVDPAKTCQKQIIKIMLFIDKKFAYQLSLENVDYPYLHYEEQHFQADYLQWIWGYQGASCRPQTSKQP